MSRHHGARAHPPVTPRATAPKEPDPPVVLPIPLSSHEPPAAAATQESAPGLGVALRLVWMGLGNLLLAAAAILIMQHPGYSASDVLFWSTVLGLVLVRWLDISRYGGTTADYRPATPRDLRRYAVGLVAVAALAWVGAHLVGPMLR
jgi:hypothetical protein